MGRIQGLVSMSTIAMVLLTIGLCGCSKARGLTRSQYQQIELGMSIEQVQGILGPESGWEAARRLESPEG
jgi:hypothetical protein